MSGAIEEITTVLSKCGAKIHVRTGDLEEQASGVWGTIPCPSCGERMNDILKEAYEARENASIRHS